MGTSLVVRSQVKNYTKIDEKTLSVSEDFYEALNKKVEKKEKFDDDYFIIEWDEDNIEEEVEDDDY